MYQEIARIRSIRRPKKTHTSNGKLICNNCEQAIWHTSQIHNCMDTPEIKIRKCLCYPEGTVGALLAQFNMEWKPRRYECRSCFRLRNQIPFQNWENDGYVKKAKTKEDIAKETAEVMKIPLLTRFLEMRPRAQEEMSASDIWMAETLKTWNLPKDWSTVGCS